MPRLMFPILEIAAAGNDSSLVQIRRRTPCNSVLDSLQPNRGVPPTAGRGGVVGVVEIVRVVPDDA